MDKKGTLKQRGKDSWTLTVNLGKDSNGKRKRAYKTIKAKSEKEAEIELPKLYKIC